MINTVKLQQNGYLVNNTMSVPNDSANTDYQAVQAWIAEGNTPEPEFIEAELAQQTVQAKVSEYQAYLNATDHKTFSDYEPKPNEVVADIIAQRKVARDYIRANTQGV